MTQGLLDLAGKQVTVMAEVTHQRVTVDDDPVLIVFARETISDVLAVCMYFVSEIGYHDRDVRQYLLEFSRQSIDCIDNQGLELVELRSIGHASNDREPSTSSTAATGAFGLDLMRAQGPGNLVLLPDSVAAALAMTGTGGVGRTAEESRAPSI